MCAGSAAAAWSRTRRRRRCPSRSSGSTYVTSTVSPDGAGPADRDRERAHSDASGATASISPSSMRKPRIFTWKSVRPRYSSCPVGVRHRTRSPVRYIRSPGAAEGVGDEPFGRRDRPIVVAAGQAVTGDVQLTGHADRDRVQPRIEHQQRATAGRAADRHRFTGRQRSALTLAMTVASVGPYALNMSAPRRPLRHQCRRTASHRR